MGILGTTDRKENQNIGEFLNINQISPEQVIIYTRWIQSHDDNNTLEQEEIIGLLSKNLNSYQTYHTFHAYLGFNKFSIETYNIPSKEDGWQDMRDKLTQKYENEKENEDLNKNVEEYIEINLKRNIEWIRNNICDPTAIIFVPKKENSISTIMNTGNFKLHKTLDNGGIGFVVLIHEYEPNIYIFGRTKHVITKEYEDADDLVIFDNLIKEYTFLEIFIGASPLNDMTKFSGGHGNKWDGNSFLLTIKNNDENSLQPFFEGERSEPKGFKYVHIGTSIFEFTTNEKITKYVSSVGNNCVPYPYAESLNWCYSMGDCTKTPISDHPDREKFGHVDYIKTAKYETFDIDIISGRDATEYRGEKRPNSKKTGFCKFTGPVEVCIPEDTCNKF